MGGNKVIISQYLNKEKEPELYQGEQFYPLYIRVECEIEPVIFPSSLRKHLKIYNSNINRFTGGDEQLKSLLFAGLLSEKIHKKIIDNEVFPVFQLLNDEIIVLRKILVLRTDLIKSSFCSAEIEKAYETYTVEVTDFFEEKLKAWYRNELDQVFLKSIDDKENKEIFRICNYFIHFLNWQNSFYSIYDNTFEMMPSGLKKIEILLSKKLQITIKAYLTFYSHVNILNRIFEKRELGKISTLSILDWETDIQGIVLKHFEKLFGKPKAKTYVNSLDDLLEEEFNM